ncbi:MAG: oxygen-independent coproporphyrinogen III oxidase [Deltaproteobacteria bacterium CG11_big_fil_rev_8_21_14_0_20_47_16]|nr:MAG: oxygen-independent coproporphyrinogen III oxidase [Deltaproteobacteria bacterium CG11_big_fil_rev_8_21_14_0_20_47_16]
MKELLQKYDRPGPRYTSYPTAPEWTTDVGEANFWAAIERGNHKKTPLSLYVHLPFCEEHCTFCGCSTVITKKRAVTIPYLAHLFKEIDLIADQVDTSRPVIQLHWGGGTPTYLTTNEIQSLMQKIQSRFQFSDDAEVSVEVDPRVTTLEQLTAMRKLGVNRISMGVQDFNPKVQEAVNRIQPESQVRQMIEWCRNLGFQSINTDLIYGLPYQTVESFADTVSKLIAMQPDRVALFNFAFVPWMKRQQQSMDPNTLPTPADKLQIFCDAIQSFTDADYLFIGMDHFAKATDEMSQALQNRSLARNFQGYTTRMDKADMISFGITAISDIDGDYFQNKKVLTRYYSDLDSGHLAIERGKICSSDDLLRRDLIMDLFCNTHIHKSRIEKAHQIQFDNYFTNELHDLQSFIDDGLVEVTQDAITVTKRGRLLIRNIGMVFDKYLRSKASSPQRFSRTI